jgi:hypothetical protein
VIEIYGASDDLIEIGGDLREEFPYSHRDVGDLLGFADGTLLRIRFDEEGVWRITRLRSGTAAFTLEQGTEDGDGTDRATLDGDVAWVVHGSSFTSRRRP